MIIKSVKIKSVGPFEDVSFFFKEEEKVITITGENGTGKTHLISALLFTPLFREWPDDPKTQTSTSTRGVGFIEHCVGKMGIIESEFFFNNSDYKIKLTGEPKTRRQTAYIWKDGIPLNESGRLPEFDAIIAEEFPPREVFLAGPVSVSHGDGSFFSLDKKKKKDLLSKLLGITKYDEQIGFLKDILKEKKEELDPLKESLERLQPLHVSLKEKGSEVVELEVAIKVCHEDEQRLERDEKKLAGELSEVENIRGRISFIESLIEKEKNRVAVDTEATQRDIGRLQKSIEFLSTRRSVSSRRIFRISRDLSSAVAFRALYFEEHPSPDLSGLEPYATDPSACYSLDLVNMDLRMCRVCPLTEDAHYSRLNRRYVDGLINHNRSLASFLTCQRQPEKEYWDWAVSFLDQLQKEGNIEYWSIHSQLKSDEAELKVLEEKLKNKNNDPADINSLNSELYSLPYKNDLYAKVVNLSKSLEDTKAQLAKARTDRLDLEDKLRRCIFFIQSNREKTKEEHGEPAFDNLGGYILFLEENLKEKEEDYSDHAELFDILKELRKRIVITACPSIEAVTNRLLENYLDGRFRILLDVDMDDEKEDFSAFILDTNTNRKGTHVSSGEKAIVDNCLRNAFSIYSSKNSGAPFLTIFQDETTKNLSEDNAMVYMSTLRSALNIGGFEYVFFISHHKNVTEQADRRIELS